MACNYDDWTMKFPAKIKPGTKAWRVLKGMIDGQERYRTEMIYRAGIDPNPRGPSGVVGCETSDYFLYRLGYIEVVKVRSNQKVFKITQKGLDFLHENASIYLMEELSA